MSSQHPSSTTSMYRGDEATNFSEEQDPLEAVERAVEEALEMLLRDDAFEEADGNVSDQDSITTACRVAAEQSLRDELALADSGFAYRYNSEYYTVRGGGASSSLRDCYIRSFEEDVVDHQDREEWWLELKQDSVAGTSITEASSWSSSSGGRIAPTSPNNCDLDHHSSAGHYLPPQLYWEYLTAISSSSVHPQQIIDLVIASNLLAVAWNSRCRRPTLVLWQAWKQHLDERLNTDVWTRLLGSDDAYHVVVLAVPLLGSTVQLAKTRRFSCGFLTDIWSRFLTNSHDLHEIQEID